MRRKGKLDSAVHEVLLQLPKLVLRKFLARKVKEAGAEMTDEALDAFADHVIRQEPGNFTVDNDAPDRTIKLSFSNEDLVEIEEMFKKATSEMPALVLKTAEDLSESIYKRIRKGWKDERQIQIVELSQFLGRMEARWGQGLGLLQMLLTCCREVGLNASARYARSKSKRHALRRWVLERLHCRACQTTDEIICLLENGFADGAMARWRTLHELSVVALLISDGDEDLAERYISHDAVEVKRQADEYALSQVPLGFAELDKKEIRSIEEEYNEVLEKYGKEFGYPYGWAAKHLKLKKPTFKDLQIASDRVEMNSYYKLASFNVHAGARSLFFNLSSMEDSNIILAGRSNFGLLEPGARAAGTLALITSVFLGNTTSLDRTVEMLVILRLRDSVAPSLNKSQNAIIKEEKLRRKQAKERKTKGRAKPAI